MDLIFFAVSSLRGTTPAHLQSLCGDEKCSCGAALISAIISMEDSWSNPGMESTIANCSWNGEHRRRISSRIPSISSWQESNLWSSRASKRRSAAERLPQTAAAISSEERRSLRQFSWTSFCVSVPVSQRIWSSFLPDIHRISDITEENLNPWVCRNFSKRLT